jgi:hypothetical protein
MGRKPEITELPTRFLMAKLGSGRRWGRIVTVGVIGVAAAAYAGFTLLKNMEANQTATVQTQWASLAGCVIGDPLKAGEVPSTRVRAIQLTVLGTPREQRTKAAELGWPANCAAAAALLAEHADTGQPGGAELKASTTALSKAMREDANAAADIGKLVDQVWKDAAAAGLKADPKNPGGVPTPAVALFPRDVLHEPSGLAGEFAVTSLKPDPAPTKNLRFLIDDNGLVGGSEECVASGVPTVLSCKRVSAEVARLTPGLALEGTTDADAQPWIFAGDRGQLGIFRPVAGPPAITGELAYGASVVKDGSAWLLLHPASGPGAELQLVHAPLVGEVPHGRSALDSGEVDNAVDAALLWDWIIDRTGAKARPPLHLVAHRLSEKGEVGPLVDIGDAATLDRPEREDKTPRFSTCRSGANLAVHVHGARADAMTFFTGSVWTAPLPVSTRGGVLACRGNEAVLTQVTRVEDSSGSHPTVEQSRCNPSGCTASRLQIRELLSGTDVVPQESNSFTAVDINGKLLLAWSAGPLGGVRMRFAAFDRIKTTPDELITDSREDSGQSTVTELRALPTPDGAILFLNTTTGVRLFNVDTSGKLSVLHTHA